jgi:hypothetical protein
MARHRCHDRIAGAAPTAVVASLQRMARHRCHDRISGTPPIAVVGGLAAPGRTRFATASYRSQPDTHRAAEDSTDAGRAAAHPLSTQLSHAAAARPGAEAPADHLLNALSARDSLARSDLDDDRQHHRAPAQLLVDERGEVVVEDLLQEVDLADVLLRGAGQRGLDGAAQLVEQA